MLGVDGGFFRSPDRALDEAKAVGANVMEQVEEYDYGRFGWFVDPDGHEVEPWQPPARSAG